MDKTDTVDTVATDKENMQMVRKSAKKLSDQQAIFTLQDIVACLG